MDVQFLEGRFCYDSAWRYPITLTNQSQGYTINKKEMDNYPFIENCGPTYNILNTYKRLRVPYKLVLFHPHPPKKTKKNNKKKNNAHANLYIIDVKLTDWHRQRGGDNQPCTPETPLSSSISCQESQ